MANKKEVVKVVAKFGYERKVEDKLESYLFNLEPFTEEYNGIHSKKLTAKEVKDLWLANPKTDAKADKFQAEVWQRVLNFRPSEIVTLDNQGHYVAKVVRFEGYDNQGKLVAVTGRKIYIK